MVKILGNVDGFGYSTTGTYFTTDVLETATIF
jgi:hypothetical protein